MDSVAEFIHGSNAALVFTPKLKFTLGGIVTNEINIVFFHRDFQIIIVLANYGVNDI